MDFKFTRTNLFLLSLFTVVILFMATLRAYSALILVIIFILLVIYFLNKYVIISLFIILIPMGEIIPSLYNIMGIIGIEELVQLFTIFIVFSIPLKRKKSQGFTKIIRGLIFFSVIFILYVWIKDYTLGIATQTPFSFIKMYLKILLKYVIVLRLIGLINDKHLIPYINMGIFIGVLFLTLSSIFTWQLSEMGLNVETSEHGVLEDFTSNIRAKGLFTGGDVNTFAGFIVIYIGYVLTMIERKDFSKKYYIVLIFALIAILVSASRTALGGLALIAIYYFFRNIRQNRSYALIIIFALVVIVFFNQFMMFMNRFENLSLAGQVNVESQGTRIWKWNIYLQYMLSNPGSFIFGNLSIIDFYRAAHNYFINILYRGGLVPFIITLYLHIRILMLSIRKRKIINTLYIVIPYLLTIMMVNSAGANQYLLFILPIIENQYILLDNE